MAKTDFIPLLPPGVHRLTLREIEHRLVLPFLSDSQRLQLFTNLSRWINEFRSLIPSGAILWLNGSFVTAKPVPRDIDCVVWLPNMLPILSGSQEKHLEQLLDHDFSKSLLGIDMYLEASSGVSRLHRAAYWRGLFGFQHDGRSAKGFVEVII